MFSIQYIKPRCLRFRKWSRKAYAVFSSIGRHVTIGSLKSVVADKLLGKQQNSSLQFASEEKQQDNNTEPSSAQDPPDELLLPAILLAATVNYTNNYGSNVAYHCCCNSVLHLAERKSLTTAFSFFYLQIKQNQIS
ncbi:hypothetical protein ACFSPU_02905 [Haoranjiania flava]|uniref:Uncharacterized protein n=1 Tax=Haoranjiania flava TaxID=1856322 RepID=A0AAE3LP62_9BACT|nr:hypothetical protein [Haoranjiania flava]MCU7693180.1 hypothetical protein [Haoranjiania flava]